MSKIDKLAILSRDDIDREPVPVPEWGITVYVHALSGGGRDAWEASLMSGGKSVSDARAKLVVYSTFDEDGVRVFDDADVALLTTKSASALTRITNVATRLSKLGQRELEEAVKN